MVTGDDKLQAEVKQTDMYTHVCLHVYVQKKHAGNSEKVKSTVDRITNDLWKRNTAQREPINSSGEIPGCPMSKHCTK